MARLICLLACLCTASGHARSESWYCLYPGFSKEASTVARRFNVDGKLLKDDVRKTKYQIILENEHGIVAVEAIYEQNPLAAKLVVAGTTILIEKKSGKFVFAYIETGSESGTRQGRCLKD